MITGAERVGDRAEVESRIQALLESLGEGRVDGVAYDTAWSARLDLRYPGQGFEQNMEWLRRNQYVDGTWGGSLVHYHDRFVSTLAAIVALQEGVLEGRGQPRDARRVKRGEDALWKVVGKLGRDDSDTVGFPILATSLAEEATELGLEVPNPPIRFAEAYRRKVNALLAQPHRDWRETTLVFSLEALRTAILPGDLIIEENHSVAVSPSATAGYLLTRSDPDSLHYLKHTLQDEGSSAMPALAPIDIFEIAWSLYHLGTAGAISPDDPRVRRALELLWDIWSPLQGVATASHFPVVDLDDTSAALMVLQWGGFPVSADVFKYYESDDHFSCYHGETNPAVSAHVRFLAALRSCTDNAHFDMWSGKVVKALHKFDGNGSFWWDKWHASPYYVNSNAVVVIYGIENNLAMSRLKWILRTQNDDGGWGYYERSTPEETAYCLKALLWWDQHVERLETTVIDAAARFLLERLDTTRHPPLWIGKSLYTPRLPVQSAVLGTLFSYFERGGS